MNKYAIAGEIAAAGASDACFEDFLRFIRRGTQSDREIMEIVAAFFAEREKERSALREQLSEADRNLDAIRTVLENHPVVIPAYGEARHKRAVVIEVAEEAKGAFADNSAELADQEACAFPGCGKTQTHIFHAPCPGFHCSRAALFCHDYVPPKHSCA